MEDIVKENMQNVRAANKLIEDRLTIYSSNQSQLSAEYVKLNSEICPAILGDNGKKTICQIRANSVMDEYNMIEVDKYSLTETLNKQTEEYNDLLNTIRKMQGTKFSIEDINYAIKIGVELPISLFGDLISNDDCIYILLDS
jgi:hypothetical protein